MTNAWLLFRGGVLPALYDKSWVFSQDEVEQRLFQTVMFRRIRHAYER